MTHRWTASLGILALAGIAACSTTSTPAEKLVTACESADAALRVAIVANQRHALTDAQVNAVTRAGTIANAFCSQPVAPDRIPTALSAVAQAVADLTSQVH